MESLECSVSVRTYREESPQRTEMRSQNLEHKGVSFLPVSTLPATSEFEEAINKTRCNIPVMSEVALTPKSSHPPRYSTGKAQLSR